MGQKAIREQNGQIVVETTHGVSAREQVNIQSINSGNDEIVPKNDNGKGALLIIEDDAMCREVLARMLSFTGFKVYESESAALGLELLKSNRKKIVACLVDLVLPDSIDGEIVNQIKTVEPDIPLVIMSGYLQSTVKARYQTEMVLGKPFSYHELLEKLNLILDSNIQEVSMGNATCVV
jgi:DNA-binding NtrC family response regulator